MDTDLMLYGLELCLHVLRLCVPILISGNVLFMIGRRRGGLPADWVADW